jgi:hypothetical protein
MMDTTRELIPQIPTWPVVGPLPFVLTREGIVPGLTRMAERFRREGVFRVPLPGADITFVCNAALAAEVMDDERWEKVLDPFMLRVRLLGGDGLFTRTATKRRGGRRTGCSRPRSPGARWSATSTPSSKS